MKVISKKQYLIEKILEKTKPHFHKDLPELNDILYKHKYFDMVGRTWLQFLQESPINKLNNLMIDINNSSL